MKGRAITRTANLVLRFKEYGSLVSQRWPTRLDLRMPFFYLRTQGFWQGVTLQMRPAESPESCFVCELNEEFFKLLGDADFRLKARLLLVSRYFEPPERVALLESLGLCADGLQKAERRMCELNEEGEEAARRKGRDARFAVQVVSRYKFVVGPSTRPAAAAAIKSIPTRRK